LNILTGDLTLKRFSAFVILLALLLSLSPVASGEPAQEIVVSAAISLNKAFEELGKLYEAQNKDGKIVFNFGASDDLMAQIKGGAPVSSGNIRRAETARGSRSRAHQEARCFASRRAFSRPRQPHTQRDAEISPGRTANVQYPRGARDA
jgi:hypothetical protein